MRHTGPLRLAAVAAIAVLWATPVRGSITSVFGIGDAEKAPVLVTGEVVSVSRVAPATLQSGAWKLEVWRMTADVRVLRSFTKSIQPMERIQIGFLKFAPGQPMLSPPMLPSIETGQTLIFPLRANDDNRQPYELLDFQGAGLTIPAHADLSTSDSAPVASAHAFILRELANAVALGSRAEIFAIANYLRSQGGGVAGELIPLIESQVGDDRDRWVEIATGLIAGTGTPRPTFAELRNQDAKIPEWAAIARIAVRKLDGAPQADALLIRRLIADAPINAWGSAGALLEFGDHPVLIEALRQALRDDVDGSSSIAWTLAHNGHLGFLDDALARALRVVSKPAISSDVQGAAALLRDFGSDAQLAQLAALVRKYQASDRAFYNSLWQYSFDMEHPPRNARVLNVVLNDHEPAWDGLRVCDYAVAMLSKAVHQELRAKSQDEAVAQARAWLDIHKIQR